MAKQAKQGARQSNGRFLKKEPTQAIGGSKDNPNAVVPPKPTTDLSAELIDKALAASKEEKPMADNGKANSSYSTAFVSSWDEKQNDVVQPGNEPDIAPTPAPSPTQVEKKDEPAPAPVVSAPPPAPAPVVESPKPATPVKPVEEIKPAPVTPPAVEVQPVEAPKAEPVQPVSPLGAPLPTAPNNLERVRPVDKPVPQNSYFDGKPWQVLLNYLLDFFAIVLTLGIAFPWVYCHDLRWEYDHMVYEGKRLHFDGRGSQLIGHWILWYFLTAITLGIYGWWIPIKLMKWKVKHCHFE